MLIGVPCVIVVERLRIIYFSLSKANQLWCFSLRSFGVSWVLPRIVFDILFWLVELIGEAFVSNLEFSSVVHTMLYLEGTESADF